jgi:hypothetical protein
VLCIPSACMKTKLNAKSSDLPYYYMAHGAYVVSLLGCRLTFGSVNIIMIGLSVACGNGNKMPLLIAEPFAHDAVIGLRGFSSLFCLILGANAKRMGELITPK